MFRVQSFLQSFSAFAGGVVLVLLLAVGPARGLAQTSAEVSVDTASTLHKVDPRIYGQFVEHFGRIVQGGLWAELLENRKFSPVDPDRAQVANPWKPESDRTYVSYVIDRAISLNGISAQRVSLFGTARSWRGISQTGFDVLGGKEYVAYAWIKTDVPEARVSFRLEAAHGEVAAHAEAKVQRGDWQKYEVRLTPGRDLRPATFRIAFDSPGIRWIGAASLMPADHVNGMRPDVLELVKRMAPPIIRWPGGGYSDAYDWRKAIGPRDQRPTQPRLPYGIPYGYDHGIDTDDFGTDEFLQFCSLIGAEPFITVNFGMGTPEMAADWVQYCNGPADSKWGAVRAANGRPAPYGVKNWGVGNELWLYSGEPGFTNAEGYATYFIPMAQAMRAVDPTVQITAVGGFMSAKGWDEPLLQRAWEHIDLLSLHTYYPGGSWPAALVNDPVQAYKAVVAQPDIVEQNLQKLLTTADQITQNRKKILIAFDEWNEWDWDYPRPVDTPARSTINQIIDLVNKSGLEMNQTHRDGMYAARMLHVFMRAGDRLPIACRTHLVNSFGAIRTDSTRAFITASGIMMELYRQHSGTTLLKTDVRAPSFDVPEQGWTGIPSLDATATLSADGRKLFVHLINLEAEQPMQVRLQIKGRGVSPEADAWQIASQDFLSRNDFGVTNVYIQHNPVRGASQDFTHTLPPHSATILEINLK
jgi:alpha-N-arabinofuranosidase